MTMAKTICAILLVVVVALIIWLTWWVLPDKYVVTSVEKCDIAQLHGPVLTYFSSNHKSDRKAHSNPIQIEKWRNLEIANGWSAVEAWMPFAVVIFLVGASAGGGLGWLLRSFDAEEKYKDQIKDMTEKVELSKTTMADARKLERGVSEAHERAVKWVERIEKESAANIATAEADTVAESGLRLEAERKLETERAKHEEELKKAGARIAELKAKTKKN